MSAVPFVKRRPTFTSILVAVDESEPARWATQLAVRLAKELKAAVSLVHVVSAPGRFMSEPLPENTLLKLVAADDPVLKAARALVPDELAGGLTLREGEAAPQIVDAARECAADLIVIGTHGRGVLGRFLLGSTAEAVVRRAPCPALTVAHPIEEATVAVTAPPTPYEVAQPVTTG